MPNKLIRPVSDSWVEFGGIDFGDFCGVGNYGGDSMKGALRFTGVALNQGQSVNFAELRYVYSSVGTTGGRWKFRVWGIKEANTAAFGYPFGRTKTTAVITIDEDSPVLGVKAFNVTSIVQEIVNQGGWSSGNAIGFLIEDNGSTTDSYAFTDTYESYLATRQSSAPNMKPTPISVIAPSIPAAEDWGIKISYPGVSVLEATEEQLYYTTRKKQFKVIAENTFTSTGAGESTVLTHGLGYTPKALCYFRFPGDTEWKELTAGSMFDGAPYYRMDSTTLRIYAPASGYSFYYYVFLDQVA